VFDFKIRFCRQQAGNTPNHRNKNFATWDKELDTETQKLDLNGGQAYGFSTDIHVFTVYRCTCN
jgi:hypothetical protein